MKKLNIQKLACSDELNDLIDKFNITKNKDFLEQCEKILEKTQSNKLKNKKNFGVEQLTIINDIDSVISNKSDKKEKEFYKYLSNIIATTFMGDRSNNNGKLDKSKLQGELLTETLLGTIYYILGSDTAIKLINFPNNILIFNVGYGMEILFICPYPRLINPKFIIFSTLNISYDTLPRLCRKHNSIQNIDSGAKSLLYLDTEEEKEDIFIFYSKTVRIGRNFYDLQKDNNVIKELLLASYWIDSNFLPISRKTDIYGEHFLEARAGKYNNNSVFICMSPVKSVYEKAFSILIWIVPVIFVSLVLIYFIANTIIFDLLAPVKQLIVGAKSASVGNFSYRTNFDTGDELGELCISFDKMMKSLEEKQLMNRMVSKTALSVSANEKDIASKKIDAVILYVTVPEFDEIMKNTPSFELFTKLKKQIATIADIVINNGGDIDKIIGEKLLIAFYDNTKSVQEIAISAFKTAYYIEKFEDLPYKVAVGINFGQVISGFLGVGNKRDFTIIGDPVNVTSRIAVFAEKLDSNRLVVSENIKNLIDKEIKTQEYGEVLFKGKTLPSKVYRIAIC